MNTRLQPWAGALLMALAVAGSGQTQDGAPPPACAVLPFAAKGGLTAEEASLLGDKFAVELDRTGRYRLINRANIQDLLGLQQLSMADFVATSESAVEFGRILGARYVAYGSAGRFGDLYLLTTHLIDIETGQAVASAATEENKSKEDLLTRGVPANVRQLLRLPGTDLSGAGGDDSPGRGAGGAPVGADAALVRAQDLLAQGLYDDAILAAQQLQRDGRQDAAVYLLLGQAYARKKGWYAFAVRSLDKAVQLEPQGSAARVELARVHLEIGQDPEKSVALLEQALRLDPGNAAAKALLDKARGAAP